MNKHVLQAIIIALLLVIGYLVYDDSDSDSGSTIQVGEPTITETPVPEVQSDSGDTSELQIETTSRDEVDFSGIFLGFADGKDQYLGSFKYAMIDDGTEIIRVDLRSIVGYDTTGLEEQLGVQTNNRVTVRGFLENGEFVATYIKAE